MRRPLLVALVLGLFAVGSPVAHATPSYHYVGGCGMTVANDTTPGSQIGGPTQWNGEADIVAVATNENLGTPAATASIHVVCDLYINWSYAGTLLTASGTGVALAAGPTSFVASPWDVVHICETVDVHGDVHVTCYLATFVPAVPVPVANLVVNVLTVLDPTLCLLLGGAAPGLPGTVDVDPNGDVRVLGDTMYDCPPYGSTPPKYYDQAVMFVRHL